MEILMGVLMVLIVALISYILSVLVFLQGLAAFIGLPLAMRAGAKQCKKIYLIYTLWTTVFDIVVIVLMLTVLNQFLVWILLGYFIIPLIIFLILMQKVRSEVKERIAKEVGKDKLQSENIYDATQSHDGNEDYR